jgi:hypothetical protein
MEPINGNLPAEEQNHSYVGSCSATLVDGVLFD